MTDYDSDGGTSEDHHISDNPRQMEEAMESKELSSANPFSLSRRSLSEEEVLRVVMTGDQLAIRCWVETQLPVARPNDNASENHSSFVTPEVEAVLFKVLKRMPAPTKKLFRDELARR